MTAARWLTAEWRAAVAGAAAVCGVLVVAACGASPQAGSRPAVSSADSAVKSSASPAAVRPASPAATVPRAVLAAQYLAIARPANKRLDHDFDGLQDASHDDLNAAARDLRDAAATERRFDRQLLRLSLPPAEEAIARLMVTANKSRARLSDRAAASASLTALHRYLSRLTAANAPVEEAVDIIRGQLGLPAPETS
jgi:hypothetical protein